MYLKDILVYKLGVCVSHDGLTLFSAQAHTTRTYESRILTRDFAKYTQRT